MRRPHPLLSRWVRWQPWILPALLLVALWLPGANQGWPRADSHYYAAMGMQAWRDALAAGSIDPLLHLRAGDAAYFNKPPLAFWIHGLVLHVLGFSMWAMRLPALLAAIGAALATVDVARRVAGPKVGLLSGLVLATTVEFFRYAKGISLDLWLALWIALVAALVVRGARKEGPATLHFLAAGLPLGAALLTKQLVGLLPMALLAAWMLLDGRWRRLPLLGVTMAAGALLALPWHVAAAANAPGAGGFLETYLVGQVAQRAADGGPDLRPWWTYLRLLVENYWPWLVTFVAALPWLAARWGRLRPGDRSLARFGIVVGVGWLVLLSLFKGRMGRYAIPMYGPLAMPSALLLARALPAANRRGGRVPMLLVGPMALVGGTAVAIAGMRIHPPMADEWRTIDAWLTEHGDPPLYVTRLSNNNAAKLALLGRPWPRLVQLAGLPVRSYDEPQPLPRRGIVLMTDLELARASTSGEVVLETGGQVLFRVSGPRDP